MNNPFNDNVRRRLLSRRDKIAAILRNLEIQKMELSKRTAVNDNMLEPIRTSMLDSVDGWYHKELNDVDNALARTQESHFGICLGCGSEIDRNRLEKWPEAEFCRTCEDLRKWMELG